MRAAKTTSRRAIAAATIAGAMLLGVASGAPQVAGGGENAHENARENGPAGEASVRFEARDIYIDTRDRELAAYQIEFLDVAGRSVVAGVEGGEHAAFEKPPYYDSAALRRGRLIIAAFNTGEDLPRGRTRVARLHLEIRGEGEPEFDVKLIVCATSAREGIPATVSLEKRKAR